MSCQRQRVGLYFNLHRENITQHEVVVFLRCLLRQIKGAVVLLWDGGKIHTGVEVQAFIRRHPRLHVERFPAYAPELNPDEQVWNHCKAALANGRPDSLDELMADLCRVVRNARRRTALLRSFVTGSELPTFLGL